MHTLPPSFLAAVVHPDYLGGVDTLLADFCRSLQAQGHCVGGVVQANRVRPGGGKWMLLQDVRTGEEFSISQDLGAQSQSCCLDPAGVAQASMVLRQALLDRVDVTVANRFGALEAAGAGFSSELLALMADERPLLTLVSEKHLQAWRSFTGGLGYELPPCASALHSWFALVMKMKMEMEMEMQKTHTALDWQEQWQER
ncbi:MAG: DUF2478 domain-containing protein [Burkholderiaceae bacterium]|nr:DUF2478 domain-containing protein [Burkholderiaceae bacterium]